MIFKEQPLSKYLVELQHPKLDLLVLVLLLLWLGVGLLLPLLGTTKQTSKDLQGGLVLNTSNREEGVILQLLAVEQNTLLLDRQSCRDNQSVSQR
jgi:hypothetical protein